MFAPSGRRDVRGTAPVVAVQAVEGVGANVQSRTRVPGQGPLGPWAIFVALERP